MINPIQTAVYRSRVKWGHSKNFVRRRPQQRSGVFIQNPFRFSYKRRSPELHDRQRHQCLGIQLLTGEECHLDA